MEPENQEVLTDNLENLWRETRLCRAAKLSPPEENWQSTRKTVRERNGVLFNNNLMSDVTFIVGQESTKLRVPGHRYVLASGSAVFYAMFYGALANNGIEISIPDVEPTAFLILLRYLYTDDIELEGDDVISVLYTAKKYQVPFLAEACVDFLESKLTSKNACLLLGQSCLFEERNLMQHCWEVIDAQAEEALTADDFADIDRQTLESILKRETLNCKEVTVFHAVLRWATAECNRQRLDPTTSNLRKVLSNVLYLLRIPSSMTAREFADGPAQSGLLTPQEVSTLFIWYNASPSNKPSMLPFPLQPRQGLRPLRCRRFLTTAYRNNQWRYRGRCDSIQFCVDRRIFIAGFSLYGSSGSPCEYKVTIELKRNFRRLTHRVTTFSSDGTRHTFPVLFDSPVQIEADTFYVASATLEGKELSFFGQEGLSEVSLGGVTFQFQCSSESTNGTGVQGGQIPEIIFYSHTSCASSLDYSMTKSLSDPSHTCSGSYIQRFSEDKLPPSPPSHEVKE